ncbi:HK97 family phage portal protein [Pontibacter mucosus]|uniref:HK97 family phage portal protein n=1 Tax=Pontibacter mucosus TaxID=1649266 RepID=A0A2T5YD36_9BACT|nr:phage portal protein [Pontibacter mucosus]PTX14438.1 HK97 family phage portal protein [Pontibacter mucosus]
MGLLDSFFSGTIQKQVNAELSRYNLQAFRFLADGQPIYLDAKAESYITEGYTAIGAVYECVNLILKKIASSPPIIYEIKDEAKRQKWHNLSKSDSIEQKALALQLKAQAVEEVSPKEIQELLNKPNPLQGYKDYIRQLAGFYLLTGETMAYNVGPLGQKDKIVHSWPLPTHLVDVISGGMFEPIKEYIFKFSTDKTYAFPASDVARIRMFNPLFDVQGSQLRGMSPLRAYLKKLARAKAGDKEVLKQLQNGGAFGILSPKNAQDTLTPAQKDALKQRLIDAKNAKDDLARIFPATVAMDWQQIALSIADQKLLELLQATDEDIYRAYGIPLVYRSTDASTLNNEQHASRKLIYDAVQPIADDLSELLTKIMCEPVNKRLGKKYYIELDTSSLPEMQNDMKAISEWLEKSHELTMNEKREVKGWGRLEAENMDIPLVPKNLTRVDMVHLTDDAFTQGVAQETQQ